MRKLIHSLIRDYEYYHNFMHKFGDGRDVDVEEIEKVKGGYEATVSLCFPDDNRKETYYDVFYSVDVLRKWAGL